MKIVIASGGFDPLNGSGHISYLKAAAALGDILIVGCNSDEWLIRKKGRFFMTWEERAIIVAALKPVDHVMPIYDDFDGSSINLIRAVIRMEENAKEGTKEYIFANGGDRTATNIPEMLFEYERPVNFVFGVGGDTKLNSSSKILEEWEKKLHKAT